MNNYKCEILADSINPKGDRLTTMKITFPRFILAEMNTHRMFSRNSASSRAIPFKKMVKMVEENPFIPLAWQRDHKGMQGTEYLEVQDGVYGVKEHWLEARNKAVELATALHQSEVTKQLCNRLLEPFMWHTVIVTATEFSNFFKLRCPQYKIAGSSNIIYKSWKDVCKDYLLLENKTALERFGYNTSQADIHIQAIAELMWDAMNESTPKQLEDGEWHIPYGDNINDSKIQLLHYGTLESTTNVEALYQNSKIKIATARCARISYETLGDNPKIDYEADIKLHDRLLAEGHMPSFEHCAKAMSNEEYNSFFNGDLRTNDPKSDGWCRNFRGWISYRSIIDK